MKPREWYAVVHIGRDVCIGWYSQLEQAEKRVRRTTSPTHYDIIKVREVLEK